MEANDRPLEWAYNLIDFNQNMEANDRPLEWKCDLCKKDNNENEEQKTINYVRSRKCAIDYCDAYLYEYSRRLCKTKDSFCTKHEKHNHVKCQYPSCQHNGLRTSDDGIAINIMKRRNIHLHHQVVQVMEDIITILVKSHSRNYGLKLVIVHYVFIC